MTRTVKEWIAKAEGDFASARREMRARKDPNFDAACFHSQQCVEKLMKGLLLHRKLSFPKTHDLVTLLQLLEPGGPSSATLVEDLRFLTRAAVAFRYPGEAVTREDAKDVYGICVRLRELWRKRLGLRESP